MGLKTKRETKRRNGRTRSKPRANLGPGDSGRVEENTGGRFAQTTHEASAGIANPVKARTLV